MPNNEASKPDSRTVDDVLEFCCLKESAMSTNRTSNKRMAYTCMLANSSVCPPFRLAGLPADRLVGLPTDRLLKPGWGLLKVLESNRFPPWWMQAVYVFSLEKKSVKLVKGNDGGER